MLARWIATVAALLLACAQASAHVRSERAADLGTFATGTEHALEIERSAAKASPGELARNPKTAPPARASLENSASGENAALTHCHAWENWSPLKKCASGVDKYLYGNGNPGSYVDPDGRVGFLTDLRDWFNETDRNLREYAENTPYVGGAIGLVRGATSLASAPVRAVNTASDAVAGALPFEVTSGVAEEGAIAFGESVDLGVYVANNKAAVAGAIKDNVIDTASRTFFDRDGAAASDFVSGVAQFVVPSPAIARGVASTVGRLTPSVTRGLQTASRGLAAVRDRVVQAFRVAESPSGSPVMRFDTDGEAGSGFQEHPVAQQSRRGDFHGPWRDAAPEDFKWRSYFSSQTGTSPPIGMPDPHAHHILPKKGRHGEQRQLIQEGQELLRNRAGIDPIWGTENLVWAPNRVTEQHSTGAIRQVVERLRELDQADATPEDFAAALRELGQIAADRR